LVENTRSVLTAAFGLFDWDISNSFQESDLALACGQAFGDPFSDPGHGSACSGVFLVIEKAFEL